ncbi:hypothetical protein [Archaeoglobus sp.]
MRVRIAGLHASDKKPVVGDDVVIKGYVQGYDEKKKIWQPLRTRVWVDVDGLNYGVIYTNPDGSFEFRYSSNVKGKKKIEFKAEGCKREIEIEFVDRKEKARVERIGTIAVMILILLLILLYLIMVMLKR